jgi:DNA topoisomerase-1
MLEKCGIGRPSTYSNLISKIQERGYVNKQNVDGKKIHCVDFELIGEELTEVDNMRVFGNEKNKLVIQPTGVIVYEFLEKHFDALFNYDYTKNMEDNLDKISKGKRVWHTLCDECNNQIKESSKDIVSTRETYKIDKNHVYMIGRYGPVIKYEKDGETSFKAVKKDLDIEKLKKGEYKLKDVLDTSNGNSNKKCLGEFKGNDVYVMKGKYGTINV